MQNSISISRREITTDARINAVIGVLFFILATALGAYVRIPVPGSPVPITLQTFFAILAGAVLGKRLGLFSQFGYLILGAAGLPLFSGLAAGGAHLFGPTGGYIFGFLCASYAVGAVLGANAASRTRVVTAFAVGSAVILSCGAAWLVFAYKIGLVKAVSVGVLPFIPGDIIKVLCASFIYEKISARSKSVFS
ncbi:MAG: biotin transporter BioY [Candidatus Omnitrophica bacterium]|nr:biotin transporter BioY [Candidatus Omnitrophota bacterium]